MHFYRTAIWVALVWSRRGCTVEDNVVKWTFWRQNFYDFFALWRLLRCASYTCWPADIHTTYSLCAGVFKCTKSVDMLLYTSVWGPFKKCLVAVTHEYVIAVERIFERAEMWIQPRFIVLFHGLRCYCIILWPKLGISGKLTLFNISFRRPEVLKITPKIEVRFDIYVWKPACAADR